MGKFVKKWCLSAAVVGILIAVAVPLGAVAAPTAKDGIFYRGLTQDIRKFAKFQIPLAGQAAVEFTYSLEFDQPLWPLPLMHDSSTGFGEEAVRGKFYRSYFDKIFLKEGSSLKLNGVEIPLTCVFVEGQDNRFSGKKSPLVPEFVMKVYLVANSYTCDGPIRRGWPQTGGKREAWDTYLYFEIRDPTIMLPTEILLRYRWNESHSILIGDGEAP